jgi:hypothetical protein
MARPENREEPNMEIYVTFRQCYGNWLCDALCPKGRAFCAITGNKTLNRTTLRQIHAIGFSIIECDRNGKPVRRHGPETRGSTLPVVA